MHVAMTTTETLKQGTSLIAETAGELADRAKEKASHVVEGAAERLAERRDPPPKKRRSKILLVTALAAGLGVLAKLARRSRVGHLVEEKIIDLTGVARTDEATLERLASEGLDPVARGGSPL